MMKQNMIDFKSTKRCWICNGRFTKSDYKVRDHSHTTGLYRGAAHKSCNLKLALKPGKTPIRVVFHNLKGYDSHLIFQQIAQENGRITCIPKNAEKYISFSLGQLGQILGQFHT